MVVAAIALRGAIDDDDGGDGVDDGELVLVCAADLVDACHELGSGIEVRSEPAATTAAAIDDGSLPDDVDAWITSTAWVEVVDSRTPNDLGEGVPLATSPAVVATAPGRFDAIADLCEGDDVWRCLGDNAGRDWGDLGSGDPRWAELKVGLTDPDSATGLSVLASATAGFFDGTDFAANDFAGGFEGWLATLAEPSASGDPDPALTLATRAGTYSAAGAVRSAADQVEERGVQVIAPEADVRATVVIVGLNGNDDLPNVDRARDALVDEGWARASDDDVAPTLKAGVMAALHSLWRQVTA